MQPFKTTPFNPQFICQKVFEQIQQRSDPAQAMLVEENAVAIFVFDTVLKGDHYGDEKQISKKFANQLLQAVCELDNQDTEQPFSVIDGDRKKYHFAVKKVAGEIVIFQYIDVDSQENFEMVVYRAQNADELLNILNHGGQEPTSTASSSATSGQSSSTLANNPIVKQHFFKKMLSNENLNSQNMFPLVEYLLTHQRQFANEPQLIDKVVQYVLEHITTLAEQRPDLVNAAFERLSTEKLEEISQKQPELIKSVALYTFGPDSAEKISRTSFFAAYIFKHPDVFCDCPGFIERVVQLTFGNCTRISKGLLQLALELVMSRPELIKEELKVGSLLIGVVIKHFTHDKSIDREKLIGWLRSKCGQITFLKLANCQMDEQGVQFLAEVFKDHKQLTRLDLSANHIGVQGKNFLVQMLEQNPKLTQLDLCATGIDAEFIVGLFKFGTIAQLDVSGNVIGSKGAIEVAQVLQNNRGIVNLNLSNTQLGDEGATLILIALRSAEKLRYLNLTGNTISGIGMNAVADFVYHSKNLTHLELSKNTCTYQSLTRLINAIKQHPALVEVGVDCNYDSTAGEEWQLKFAYSQVLIPTLNRYMKCLCEQYPQIQAARDELIVSAFYQSSPQPGAPLEEAAASLPNELNEKIIKEMVFQQMLGNREDISLNLKLL